jgi:hypothetical protein
MQVRFIKAQIRPNEKLHLCINDGNMVNMPLIKLNFRSAKQSSSPRYSTVET